MEKPIIDDTNEHPSMAFISKNIIVACDGSVNGKYYILDFSSVNKTICLIKTISKRYIENMDKEKKKVLPLVLLDAKMKNDGSGIYILGYSYSSIDVEAGNKGQYKKKQTNFFVTLCEIACDFNEVTMDTGSAMEIIENNGNNIKLISSLKGDTTPSLAFIEENMKGSGSGEGGYVIINENESYTEYISPKTSKVNPGENLEGEIKSTTSNLDNTMMVVEKQEKQLQQNIPLPRHLTLYKWCQEIDDITIYIHLFEINKNNVKCQFKSNKLYLKVQNETKEEELFNDELWDEVISDECIWTLEKNKARNGSIITLHLEKKNQIRWIQMFKEDDRVLETVDPSELSTIKERLLMFTGHDDQDGLQDPYQKINSIQQTEECDLAKSPISFIRASKSGQITDVNQGSGFEWLCTSFPTISTSSISSEHPCIVQCLCLKQDIDGIIFEVEPRLKMKHCAVFNALGFVEASKQNRKFAYISDDFEYALIADTTKLVNVYAQPSDEETRNKAFQYLVDVSHPSSFCRFNDNENKDELLYGLAQLDRHVFVVLKQKSLCVFSLM